MSRLLVLQYDGDFVEITQKHRGFRLLVVI